MERTSIKKIVLSTIFITLLTVIVLTAVLYSSLSIFMPKTLASFYDSIGADSLSLKYYERQYDISENLSDLIIVCDKVDEFEKSKDAETYVGILIKNEDFTNLCNASSGGSNVLPTEYYYGKYATAVCINKGFDEALRVCEMYVRIYGKTECNPYVVLLLESETLGLAEVDVSYLNGINGII